MGIIMAGVSRVTITPPVGIYLVGMERFDFSNNLRDDLYATALAISNGSVEVVILSMDLLMIHPEMVRKVRQDVTRITGIPGNNIMFCATHCHSGPATYSYPDSRPIDQAFTNYLPFLFTGLIRMAHDRLAPANVGFKRGEAHIGVNRRLTRRDGVTIIAANPQGPVDEEVGVIRVDSLDGTPLAVVVNYACHPVVFGRGSNAISSDWPGVMRQMVEDNTGAKVLFLQGACGDINPWPGEPCDREDVVERLGIQIGGEVLQVWAQIESGTLDSIHALRKQLLIPLQPVSQYANVVPDLVELTGIIDIRNSKNLQGWIKKVLPWFQELQRTGDELKVPMEIQGFRFGNIAMVSAAGEIFVKTGKEIKKKSPFSNTLFVGYANGDVGYIPLPEDFLRGGYEVDQSYLLYGLPAPVVPEAAAIIEEGFLELLSNL